MVIICEEFKGDFDSFDYDAICSLLKKIIHEIVLKKKKTLFLNPDLNFSHVSLEYKHDPMNKMIEIGILLLEKSAAIERFYECSDGYMIQAVSTNSKLFGVLL